MLHEFLAANRTDLIERCVRTCLDNAHHAAVELQITYPKLGFESSSRPLRHAWPSHASGQFESTLHEGSGSLRPSP
jgi:hypothetical protein